MPPRKHLRRLNGPIEFAALQALNPERYPFLLQSTARQGTLGRYDILFAFPTDELVASATGARTFLDRLDAAFSRERLERSEAPLPFVGGWFLYLGYELAAEIEPALAPRSEALLPRAFAVRCPVALVRELASNRVWLVTEAHDPATERAVEADLLALDSLAQRPGLAAIRAIVETPARDFTHAVTAAQRYIAQGHIYQANLSREWTVKSDAPFDPLILFRRLAASNPAPFAGLLRWRDVAILSSSPERLVEVRGSRVSTRPIAGTRPRSADAARDRALLAELIAHPKERAEHVMLIDLERNDLGRISVPGTVRVDETMVLETYAHVHHIVSKVSGRLRPGTLPGEIIAATFPGGTITGCPKLRCMQIIQELESSPRGAYTGSSGYLNRDGSMDLNILIRTLVAHRDTVRLRAGSGIVADSDPWRELEETRAKAKGLLQAFSG